MRFKQANDSFREEWNVVPSDITKTDKGLLKKMLDNTIEFYKSQNISDLDKYYFAFVECIENVFPDEPWYENIGLDIRMDLFNTRSPKETAQHIVDAITDADAYVEENKVLTEDTIQKSNGKWTNRGDDGKEHGEFKTKKEADAQRKAMYANGYRESIQKSSDINFDNTMDYARYFYYNDVDNPEKILKDKGYDSKFIRDVFDLMDEIYSIDQQDDYMYVYDESCKNRKRIAESKFNEPTSIGKGYAAPITTDLRRHRIKDDLKYINDENPNRSKVAKNDLVRAYNEILAEIEDVEDFDAYWAEHKKALMSELKAQLDLIPTDIRENTQMKESITDNDKPIAEYLGLMKPSRFVYNNLSEVQKRTILNHYQHLKNLSEQGYVIPSIKLEKPYSAVEWESNFEKLLRLATEPKDSYAYGTKDKK